MKDSIPDLLQQKDTPIMDNILHPTQHKTTFIQFNQVQLYLGLYSIADTLSTDGLEIDKKTWEGERERFTNQLWPYQEKPNPKFFQILRQLLVTTFLKGHRPSVSRNTQNLMLRIPLGSWSEGLL